MLNEISYLPPKAWRIAHFFMANNNRKCRFEELQRWFGGTVTLERLLTQMVEASLLLKDTGGAFRLSDNPPEEAGMYLRNLGKGLTFDSILL